MKNTDFARDLLVRVKNKKSGKEGWLKLSDLMFKISNTIIDIAKFEKEIAKNLIEGFKGKQK